MGNNWSTLERESSPDPWWPASEPTISTSTVNDVGQEKTAETSDGGGRGRVRQEEIESFKHELAEKRAQRKLALSALQSEMRELRRRVEEESARRREAEEERDQLKGDGRRQSEESEMWELRRRVEEESARRKEAEEEINKLKRDDVRNELEKEKEARKQLEEERDQLRAEVEEKEGLERQVQALKDVSQIGKEMLRIREMQVKELKKKLVEINLSSVMAPPEDLRVEYEKQIENIRKLRSLYEERAAATMLEHQRALEREQAKVTVLEIKLSDLNKETDEWKEDKGELEKKIEKLEESIQSKQDEMEQIKDDLFSFKVQNSSLSSQMKLINNLFSQMLVSPEVDLDRLTRLLKENHGLITDVTTNGDSNEVAALLVDLAAQVEKEEAEKQDAVLESDESRGEIASNLSKVWRIMVELLSHHRNTSHVELAGGADSCYKCIQTPSGPKSVISVSRTFLTLKDLILEKNQLMKEVGRLKTLNNHLEHRLGSQEKRLSIVTTELRKTWSVVNKLKVQHKQLHTHEKILRYELQQKRFMLTELKEELEHCKDKWQQAREKNSQTEEDWKELRKEFAARKSRTESNSAESGYEEEDIGQSEGADSLQRGLLLKRKDAGNGELEMTEDDIEHSDGNSFDTVIDLLDVSCIESPVVNDANVQFTIPDIPPQGTEIIPNSLPLTLSEFTEGLDQIVSEDLAAILDEQYQTQLLGADYNLSLPSSSGSSPIPTENDEFVSSEMDASEEDLSSLDNQRPSTSQASLSMPEKTLLVGSNSSMNISKFLDGLLPDQEDRSVHTSKSNLCITGNNITEYDSDSATPIVNNNCYQFPNVSEKPTASEEGSNSASMHTETPQEEIISSKKDTNSDYLEQNASFDNKESSSQESNEPNTSFSMSTGDKSEDALNAREERLRKLEKQCRSLVAKVTSTSFRSEIIANKLDELHLCYGSSNEVSDVEEESIPLASQSNAEQEASPIKQMSSCKKNDSNTPAATVEKTESHGLLKFPEEVIEHQTTKNEQNTSTKTQKGKNHEEILEARAARLKRLEDQCKSLFSKMSATSSRSDLISNKLDELHDSYGPAKPSTSKSSRTSHIKSRTSSFESGEVSQPLEVKNNCKSQELATESKEILNRCSIPGPSVELTAPVKPKQGRTAEEILEARAERFKSLEEQCKSLVSKMTATSLRSEIISNKLDELHSCYGSSEDTSENEEHCHQVKEPSSHDVEDRLSTCVQPTGDQAEGVDVNDRFNERLHEADGQDSHQEKCNKVEQFSDKLIQSRSQRIEMVDNQGESSMGASQISETFLKLSGSSERSDGFCEQHEDLSSLPSISPDENNSSNSTNVSGNALKNGSKTKR